MNELIVNLHMHTVYSDGDGSHQDILNAAIKSGIDVAIVTDHNTLVGGVEQYFKSGNHKGLLLVGEEIHNQDRQPQKSHLLVFNANQELAQFASDPQTLVDRVNASGGLSFIAHPVDPELKLFHEDDISWVDWDVAGFTGMEIWNGFSEFKGRIKNFLSAIFLAFNPHYVAEAPYPAALEKWDELLMAGRKVVAIGGSDAHALRLHLGPLKRIVFPYEVHFESINTHILAPAPLTGNMMKDKQMIYETLEQGHSFIGYDLPASTKGFRFTAQSTGKAAQMGDEVEIEHGVTFQIRMPEKANVRLIRNGKIIREWDDSEFCTFITSEAGVYRVEAYIQYLGKSRGWIFSNPIFVKKPALEMDLDSSSNP